MLDKISWQRGLFLTYQHILYSSLYQWKEKRMAGWEDGSGNQNTAGRPWWAGRKCHRVTADTVTGWMSERRKMGETWKEPWGSWLGWKLRVGRRVVAINRNRKHRVRNQFWKLEETMSLILVQWVWNWGGNVQQANENTGLCWAEVKTNDKDFFVESYP